MNKVIVITGGSDGLGKTLTEHFSKENNVIILARDEEKLKSVANDKTSDFKQKLEFWKICIHYMC